MLLHTSPVRTDEVIAHIADDVEARLEDVVDAMGTVIFAALPALGADDTLRTESLASCRGNVRRYVTVARRSADPPPANVPPEALDLARTVVRRGIPTDAISQAYRLGQQELWRQWMRTAQTTASPEQLAPVLDISLDLLFRYVDTALRGVLAEVEREREQVMGGALARRAETIRLLLDGAPLDTAAAAQRLGYELDSHHTALALWSDDAGHARQGRLETAAVTVAQAWGVRRPLTLAAGVGTLWAWVTTDGATILGYEDLEQISLEASVRIAIGRTLPGPVGFRRSHETALAVQQLMRRSAHDIVLETYDRLEIVALVADDQQRVTDFVTQTLGPLAADTTSAARLRETLRVFLEEAENAPRAAHRLHTHRNTILQRVARAQTLLGYRPGSRRLALELALELQRIGIGTKP